MPSSTIRHRTRSHRARSCRIGRTARRVSRETTSTLHPMRSLTAEERKLGVRTMARPSRKTVVVIDDDRDIAEVVQTILLDEGFKVSCLYDPTKHDVTTAIERIEPDCVLLDGGS